MATPVVPVARFIRTMRVAAAKGYGPELRRAAPAIWLLLVAPTAGQVVGPHLGPGDSPGKVQ
jgi:hypothetical protein